MQRTVLTQMNVANYETRQNSKQVTYIIQLDPMHGCGVIICMNMRDLSVKLQLTG